jgi:hypothetical protein
VNRIVLALVVAAGLFAAVVYFRGGKEHAESTSLAAAKEASASTARTPAPDVVLAIKPGAPRPAVQSAVASKVSPLMRELVAGPRKALYERLSQKPSRTPEESYVLAMILEMCTEVPGRPRDSRTASFEEARKNFAAGVSDKDSDRARRIAAFEKIADPKCAGFEAMKTDPQRIKDLVDEAAAGGDPKARVRIIDRAVWACCQDGTVRGSDSLPTMSDENLAALQDIVRTGDPYAMVMAGSMLSSTLGNLMIRAGPEERSIDPRAFYDAWMLAACGSGLDCGATSAMVLTGCAYSGNCGAQNVEEYLYFYGNSPQQSQLINEYRSQLTRAIQSGDWSYFTFVHASPPQGSVFLFRGSGLP